MPTNRRRGEVPATTDPQTGLSVLLIESDPEAAASLAAWLGLQGHRSAVAEDLLTALAQTLLEAPDVVIVEIDVPETNGWEIVRQLYAQGPPAGKRPFFIATAWHGSEEDHRHAGETGIDLFLEKPLDLGFLGKLLARFQRVLAPGQAVPNEEPGVVAAGC